MTEIEKLLGGELFKEVKTKIKDLNLIIDDGKLIPKHRFDCINISLREHKEKVQQLAKENECLKTKQAEIDFLKQSVNAMARENIVLSELLKYRIKNYICIKALLKLDGTENDNLAAEIKKQIAAVKRTEPYLFYSDSELYMLVPYKEKKTEKNL